MIQEHMIRDHLAALLRRQLDEQGIVVWYDPEGHYRDIVADLDLGGAPVLTYDKSFLGLRRALDPFLAGEQPQPVVVYVPLDPQAAAHALVEAETAGAVMLPGAPSLPRNTRLSVVARAAAKASGRWTEQAADKLARDVDAGRYTGITEIEKLLARGESVLQLIFESSDAAQMALRFLTDETIDPILVQKRALEELEQRLGAAFGIPIAGGDSPPEFRARLGRFVLVSDFLAALPGDMPEGLAGVASAPAGPAREACVALADTWRKRSDLRPTYAATASRVEQELGLASFKLTIEQLASGETFAVVEQVLRTAVEGRLLAAPDPALVDLARRRQSTFWAEALPDVQARWALIASAGQVLLEADRVAAELKQVGPEARAMLTAYAEGDTPWCALDTAYRHLEHRYHTFDLDWMEHEALEALVVQARQRYSQVIASLAERFLHALRDQGFRLPGILRQTEVFTHAVQPRLKEGKTAYVLVDALRFEMARELGGMIGEHFEAEIAPAVGAVPTITEIGMAALLPEAEKGARVVSVGSDRLGLEVGGKVLVDRASRMAYLVAHAGAAAIDVALDDVLPSPGKQLRRGIEAAELVVVTSQEIDQLCESGNVSLARELMDGLLHRLERAFRVLRELGVQSIVVSADHGYLFGEEVGSDMKIEAPGGQTADLHRRVWVGKGGAADPACLRVPLAALGMGGDFDVCVPWNLAAFKVKGGSRAYFHGGMSLQELVVPVLTVRPRVAPAPVGGDLYWELVLGSAKISTRFVSVQVRGVAAALLEPVAPKVRVEVRAHGRIISTAVSASYGYEEATRSVQLALAKPVPGEPRCFEPNTVTLMIEDTPAKTADVHLADAVTGVELARLEGVEIAIAI